MEKKNRLYKQQIRENVCLNDSQPIASDSWIKYSLCFHQKSIQSVIDVWNGKQECVL